MEATGHSTERMFLKYINPVDKDRIFSLGCYFDRMYEERMAVWLFLSSQNILMKTESRGENQLFCKISGWFSVGILQMCWCGLAKMRLGKRINFGLGKIIVFCGLFFSSVLFWKTFDFCNRAGSIAYNGKSICEGRAKLDEKFNFDQPKRMLFSWN